MKGIDDFLFIIPCYALVRTLIGFVHNRPKVLLLLLLFRLLCLFLLNDWKYCLAIMITCSRVKNEAAASKYDMNRSINSEITIGG